MKPTPVPKSKVPDLQGVSLSPVCVGAISGACSSPNRSPVYTSPVNKWNYECRSDEFVRSVFNYFINYIVDLQWLEH